MPHISVHNGKCNGFGLITSISAGFTALIVYVGQREPINEEICCAQERWTVIYSSGMCTYSKPASNFSTISIYTREVLRFTQGHEHIFCFVFVTKGTNE